MVPVHAASDAHGSGVPAAVHADIQAGEVGMVATMHAVTVGPGLQVGGVHTPPVHDPAVHVSVPIAHE